MTERFVSKDIADDERVVRTWLTGKILATPTVIELADHTRIVKAILHVRLSSGADVYMPLIFHELLSQLAIQLSAGQDIAVVGDLHSNMSSTPGNNASQSTYFSVVALTR